MTYRKEGPNSTLDRIDEIKFQIKRIEKYGKESLNKLDKDKGVEWALNKLRKQLTYFENKSKDL